MQGLGFRVDVARGYPKPRKRESWVSRGPSIILTVLHDSRNSGGDSRVTNMMLGSARDILY